VKLFLERGAGQGISTVLTEYDVGTTMSAHVDGHVNPHVDGNVGSADPRQKRNRY